MWPKESRNPAMPSPLHAVLDGTPLLEPAGGIQRFTDRLLTVLREEYPEDRYTALSDQFLPHPVGIDKRWWTVGLARALARHGAHVFHGTDFAVPYIPRVPSVLTLHDLSPWLFPSPQSRRVRKRCGLLMRLRIPTLVHTPSEAVREEAIRYFRYPPERVRAIPLASHHRPPDSVTPGNYFLYLGALELRKNLGVLVEASRILRAEGFSFSLVLAGRVRDGYEAPREEHVDVRGPVDEGELPALYANSLAALYPSRYEGFGLPVLEALNCGAAAIASDLPVLRETGGHAAIYAPPDDPQAWANQMRRVLRGEFAKRDFAAHTAKFSWTATARRMRQLYEEAIALG
jgi:glycosyltransferase involved in cell wall biosynthesis